MTTDTVEIAPAELARKKAGGERFRLIDVRTPVEFREAHVEFAENIPLDRISAKDLDLRNGAPVYVICRTGARAHKACEKLQQEGLDDLAVVTGGTEGWIAAGLDVVRGKKAISLERQVRIAAGTLVFIGAVLALAVHPLFALIPAFVGAGLVFAGVTDTCGMGLLLARMPWNQSSEGGPTCTA